MEEIKIVILRVIIIYIRIFGIIKLSWELVNRLIIFILISFALFQNGFKKIRVILIGTIIFQDKNIISFGINEDK